MRFIPRRIYFSSVFVAAVAFAAVFGASWSSKFHP